MREKLRFLGMDLHAETIAAAIAEPDGEVRSLGMIPNRMESIRKLLKKLGPVEKLRVCYEAGPTGYVLYWHLAELGVQCEVIAPSLVPVKAGDRVKTDRRDAAKLARSYRSGHLTAVWFRTRVLRHCAIWYVRARLRSRMSCEHVIGSASFYCARVIVRPPELDPGPISNTDCISDARDWRRRQRQTKDRHSGRPGTAGFYLGHRCQSGSDCKRANSNLRKARTFLRRKKQKRTP
jgi:hypothetical protein